jgi:hypothetical protein
MKKLLLLLTTLILSTSAFAGSIAICVKKINVPGPTGGEKSFCKVNPADFKKTTLSKDELEKFVAEYNKILPTCGCSEQDKALEGSDTDGNLCATDRTEIKVIFDEASKQYGVESSAVKN